MNIDDVQTTDIAMPSTTLQMIEAMLGKQMTLATKYHGIETRNGFWYPDPLVSVAGYSIDDPQLQNFIKSCFWRTTEEIAEALEEGINVNAQWKTQWEQNSALRHTMEELADAMHFFVEATAFTNMPINLVAAAFDQGLAFGEANQSGVLILHEEIAKLGMDFILRIGLAANTLKNKPWKTTHMQTDERKFRSLMLEAWTEFGELWGRLFCTRDDVYRLYFQKNEVNKFRQDTNY